MKQFLDINAELDNLKKRGDWRDCQRKQYNVFACQPRKGIVFANKLEQPNSYKYLLDRFNKAMVDISQLNDNDKKALGSDCYITDGSAVVLCGTRGELWTVKPSKLISSYRNIDGSQITSIPNTTWTEIGRACEHRPSAKGIQIPIQYLARYDAGWGVLNMNSTQSNGHFKGDILVVSNSGEISVVNNEVFALTFNLNVGGWAKSGCIIPVDKLKKLKLEDVNSQIIIPSK